MLEVVVDAGLRPMHFARSTQGADSKTATLPPAPQSRVSL